MINFEVEIQKLAEYELFILKFKKIEGNPLSYRDICSLIITEINSL